MSSRITATCPRCGHQARVDAIAAGQTYQCLKCGNRFPVQADAAAAAEATFVRVTCECGKQFRVAAEHVGKKATCPACKRTLVIAAEPALAARTAEKQPGHVDRYEPAPSTATTSRLAPRLVILAALTIPVAAAVAFLVVRLAWPPQKQTPAPAGPVAVRSSPPKLTVTTRVADKSAGVRPPQASAARPAITVASAGAASRPVASAPSLRSAPAVTESQFGRTTTEYTRFTDEHGWATAVAFSLDGSRLAYTGPPEKPTIHFIDLFTYKQTCSASPSNGHVLALRFLPDNQAVLSITNRNALRCSVQCSYRGVLRRSGPSSDEYLAAEVTEDGRAALTTDIAGSLFLLDVETGHKTREYKSVHQGAIRAVATASRVNLALTGGQDARLFLWNMQATGPIAEFKEHKAPIRAVALSGDGTIGLSGDEDGRVCVWDLRRRICRARFEQHTGPVNALAVSSDGHWGASGGGDRLIWVYDLQKDLPIHRYEGHLGQVLSVAISPDCRWLASASSDWTARLWPMPHVRVQIPSITADRPATGPSPEKAAPVAGTPSAPPSKDLVYELRAPFPRAQALDFSLDSRLIAARISPNTIGLYDTTTGKEIRRLSGGSHVSICLLFLPEGNRLLSGGQSGTLVLWDVEKGAMLWRVQGCRSTIAHLAASRDGQTAAFADVGRDLYFLNTTSGQVTPAKLPVKCAPEASAFLPDGMSLVLGGGPGSYQVTLWNQNRGRVDNLNTTVYLISDVAVAPDSPIGAVAGGILRKRKDIGANGIAGVLEIWNFKTGTLIRDIAGLSDVVKSVAFSLDGRYLVAAGGSKASDDNPNPDYSIRMYQVDTGKEVYRYPGHGEPITHVAISPDGRYVASAGSDELVRVWRGPQFLTDSLAAFHKGSIKSVDLAVIGKNLSSMFPALLKEKKLGEAATLLLEADVGLRAYARQNNLRMWDRKVAPLMRRLDDRREELGKARSATAPAETVAVSSPAGEADTSTPRTELTEEETQNILTIRRAISETGELIRSRKLSLARSQLSRAKKELEEYITTQSIAEWHVMASSLFLLAEQRQAELDAQEKSEHNRQQQTAADLKEKADTEKTRLAHQPIRSASSTPKPGEPAPALAGLTLDGKTFSSAEFKGKWLLLDFWATWCGPCVGEIPNLQATYADFGANKRFVLASLSIDEDSDKLRNFVQQKKMIWFQGNLPGGWDSPVLKAWGVHGIPSIFLIDPNGQVVAAGLRGAAIKDAVSQALSRN